MGITPSLIAAGGSLLGSLSGLFGGNDAPAAPVPSYQMANMGGADTGAYTGTQNLGQYNTAAAALPYARSTFDNLYNNPYAGVYQQGANRTAQTGWNVGGAQVGGGLDLINSGQSMLPYAQRILDTGFDPEGALRARTEQQLTDSTRAGLSARGLVMSPYGAGVENKALSDFNLDWQDRQLGRQNTASQGAGYLTNSAGNAINLGQNVSTLGLQTMGQAAQLPYATANTIGANQFGAISQYGQAGTGAATIPQQQIDDYLRYIAAGNQAGGVANQQYANQLTANNQQFTQGQTQGANFGNALSGLGRAFPGGGSSWGFENGQTMTNPYNSMPMYR